MTKKERAEDLTPQNKDIEEKVRLMMDPSVPEEELKTAALSKKSTTQNGITKISVDDHSDNPTEIAEKLDEAIAELDPKSNDQPQVKTAPELPTTETEKPTASSEPAVPETPAVTETLESELLDEDKLSDPETDKAVDEIISSDSDTILEVEDALRDTDEVPENKPKKPSKFVARLRELLKSKRARRTALGVVLIGIITSASVPYSRYFLLNSAGVRVRSSIAVLDNSTGLPLKNVAVTLGQNTVKTDEQGVAKFDKLRLGGTNIKVEKLAFASIEKSIVIGLGSNPLGDYRLDPTGVQYDISVTDFLSGKPVVKAEASSGDSSAFSDNEGKIKLTIPQTDIETINVNIAADGARTESIKFNAEDQAPKNVKLVPARKHLFISKRSGKYDIYSIYIDGKDEAVVLAGSGHEKEDMVLLPHPTDNLAAYVSTRANQRNSDGYVLSNLILVHPEKKDTTNILASEKIQLIGWSGDRLIFVRTIRGESAADPKRNKLLSYNYKDGTTTELATSNYFNDVMLARGLVYFAPSSAYAGGTPAKFYRVNPDGTEQTKLLDQEVWSILRSGYEQMSLSASKYWFEFLLGGSQATRLDSPPSSQRGRAYLDSPDGKTSAWIDQRDSKGTLLNYSLESKKDTTLVSKRGIVYPLSWLNNQTLVYRLNDDQGTSDYVISLLGGNPLKISDVTHIDNNDDWYYY